MKKIINKSENLVTEMIEGFIAAYGNRYEKLPSVNGIILKERSDKVSILIGGGSGHEPLFLGFVGDGLADAVAVGNVFASPTAAAILETTKAVDNGKGVLYVYGNYAGDNLNFDMAQELAEMCGINVEAIKVWDDVASADKDHMEDRRGIAGDVFVIKIAGAAAASGISLSEVTRVAKKARDSVRSIGIALSPGTIPGSNAVTFTLPEDEIEFGMGLHGESGVRRTKMLSADELAEILLNYISEDLELTTGDEVAVLINGLGATTILELFIINRKVAHILKASGINVYETDVNSYCTCQEMSGASITVMRVDHELKKYLDAPASSPFYHKSKGANAK